MLLGLALFFAWSVPAWLAPAEAAIWLQLGWLPVFYLCALAWTRPAAKVVLSLDSMGQLRWYGADVHPVAAAAEGQMSGQSLICWLGVWLLWQTADGQTHRYWLFRDALAEADFRTLARTLCQLRWRQPQSRGLSQWFS